MGTLGQSAIQVAVMLFYPVRRMPFRMGHG
jgi:hypothetical protein